MFSITKKDFFIYQPWLLTAKLIFFFFLLLLNDQEKEKAIFYYWSQVAFILLYAKNLTA